MAHGPRGDEQIIKPSIACQDQTIVKSLRKNQALYAWFVENAVSFVVGRRGYRKQVNALVRISKVMNSGDEALALLLLENSWEHWREMYNMEFDENGCTRGVNADSPNGRLDARSKAFRDAKSESPIYTRCGGGSTKKHGGWSVEGLERYNELFGLVKKSRVTDGKAFDKFWRKRQKRILAEGHGVAVEVDDLDDPRGIIDVDVVPHTEFSDEEDNRDDDREKQKQRMRRKRELRMKRAEKAKRAQKKRKKKAGRSSDNDSEEDDEEQERGQGSAKRRRGREKENTVPVADNNDNSNVDDDSD